MARESTILCTPEGCRWRKSEIEDQKLNEFASFALKSIRAFSHLRVTCITPRTAANGHRRFAERLARATPPVDMQLRFANAKQMARPTESKNRKRQRIVEPLTVRACRAA